MPPPYFPPSVLSPAGVAEVSHVLCAQVDFPDAALSFTFIFSQCCVFFFFYFAARPPLPPLAACVPPEPRGAEPRNCLTTRCKLCVYSEAGVTLGVLGAVRLTCCR